MALDLRTGKSVWLINDKNEPHNPKLEEDISADIVIIGGGISGALLAYELVGKGMNVVLVDSRDIGKGSTSASTAILSFETDCSFKYLIDTFGEKKAVRIFQAGIEATDKIEKIISTLDDTCGFERKKSVYFASREEDVEDIKQEYSLRMTHGFDVEYLEEKDMAKLFSFEAPGAMITPIAAQLDPVRFTRALIRKAKERGLKVYAHAKIEKYIGDKDSSTAITTEGHTLRAKHFIFATGYESQQFLKLKDVQLVSTYAIASEPVSDFPGWYERSSLWESARPYLYIRTTSDNRIIVGGEDEDFVDEEKRDALLSEKAAILERKFRKLFPDIVFTFSTAWTGTFAETEDSLPFIGSHKDFPGAYFALGYGGNGTIFATMASWIIPDLIVGKENTDAEIFGFRE